MATWKQLFGGMFRNVETAKTKVKTAIENVRRFFQLNAAFDLADVDAEISEQFGRAKHESGRTALPPADRRTMIDRSRYEMFQANPWLKGSSRSTTVSVIGRGPEIEVNIAGDDEASGLIETLFNNWLTRRKAGRKFRSMQNAKQSDGAGLAICFTNAKSPSDGVQLDFAPIDVDHVRAPWDWQATTVRERCLDGKEIAASGDAVAYWITPEHPAENPLTLPTRVDARYVLDVWDWVRPSQSIGSPEYATTIKNGPLARSFRRATLDTATTAAKHSGVMTTSVDRFENGEFALEPMENWIQAPTPYGTLTALPAGWKLEQLRAEHPNTNHNEFLRSLAAEHGRGVNQPGFIAVGDGQDQNFSSMAGLRQEWELEVDVQRHDWETEALDKLLTLWLEEAALIGLIPKEYRDINIVSHTWRWKKRRHQDTQKEYSGRAVAVKAGLRSRRQWQIDDGVDPQLEDEVAAQGFGVTVEQYQRALFIQQFGDAGRNALGLPTQVDVQAAAMERAAKQGGAQDQNQDNSGKDVTQ